MRIRVDRDSVCEADDVESHALTIDLPEPADLAALLAWVRKVRYLAPIAGGRATWICEADVPLAVIAQEYAEPWPLVNLSRRVDGPIRFRYRVQDDPRALYRKLGGDEAKLVARLRPAEGLLRPTLLQWLLFPFMRRP